MPTRVQVCFALIGTESTLYAWDFPFLSTLGLAVTIVFRFCTPCCSVDVVRKMSSQLCRIMSLRFTAQLSHT